MVHTPRRTPAPQSLTENKTRWTNRWKRILAGQRNGDWATRRTKKTLQSALESLAYGKCVYCESRLGVTGDVEIEHYVAKTVDPDLAFEWVNLLPACHWCNRAKGDQDHQRALLKPDDEDPERYFWVNPNTGELQPHPGLDAIGQRRAAEAIRICDLQRPALCSKRLEMLERVGRWLNLVEVAQIGRPGPLSEEWQQLSAPATEYKLVLRHTLHLRGNAELAEQDRKRFEQPRRH